MSPNPFHLSKTAEHGSPPLAIETARNLMGVIDCDPASSAFWNQFVKARVCYDKRSNGLKRPWGTAAQPWTILLNPPGDKDGLLVKAFWEKLVEEYQAGRVAQAFWVGFNMQQLTSLQTGGIDPLDFPTVFPRRRTRYYARAGRSTRVRQGGPLHGSYYTWLPPRFTFAVTATAVDRLTWYVQQRARFEEHTSLIGKASYPRLPLESNLPGIAAW